MTSFIPTVDHFFEIHVFEQIKKKRFQFENFIFQNFNIVLIVIHSPALD